MGYRETGAAQGAVAGATAGMSGGPVGALAGAAIGGISGGLFSKAPTNYGFTKEDIQRTIANRGAEIDKFSQELSSMRSEYLAQIPGLQKAAYQRFGGDAAAHFAANGMGVDSGAFASALARAAIPMQAEMYGTAFDTGTNNAKSVDAARGGLFAGSMGAMSANTSTPTPDPMGAALGRFAGQAGMMALSQGLRPAGTVTTPAAAPAGGGMMTDGRFLGQQPAPTWDPGAWNGKP